MNRRSISYKDQSSLPAPTVLTQVATHVAWERSLDFLSYASLEELARPQIPRSNIRKKRQVEVRARKLDLHSFHHSQHSLSTCCEPSTRLSAVGRKINETKSLLLWEMQCGRECLYILISVLSPRLWGSQILSIGPQGSLHCSHPLAAQGGINHPLWNVKQKFLWTLPKVKRVRRTPAELDFLMAATM